MKSILKSIHTFIKSVFTPRVKTGVIVVATATMIVAVPTIGTGVVASFFAKALCVTLLAGLMDLVTAEKYHTAIALNTANVFLTSVIVTGIALGVFAVLPSIAAIIAVTSIVIYVNVQLVRSEMATLNDTNTAMFSN